jgi:hypothetical protein
MVTIRHKQLGDTKIVSYSSWMRDYNKDLWEPLLITNIVNLYSLNKDNQWRLHNIIEKEEAIQILKQHPNQFKYEVVPDFDLEQNQKYKNEEELIITANEKALLQAKNDYLSDRLKGTGKKLPIKTPKRYTRIIINSIIKFINNNWTITIVGGVLVVLIATYFLLKLGWISKPH